MFHVHVAEAFKHVGIVAAVQFGVLDVQHQTGNALLDFVAFIVAGLNIFIALGNKVVEVLLLMRFDGFGKGIDSFSRPIDKLGAFKLITQTISFEQANHVVAA